MGWQMRKGGKPVPFTAGDLIEVLQKVPKDTQVWMSTDEEGNGFGPLAMVEHEKIDDDTVMSLVTPPRKKVLILWPM